MQVISHTVVVRHMIVLLLNSVKTDKMLPLMSNLSTLMLLN